VKQELTYRNMNSFVSCNGRWNSFLEQRRSPVQLISEDELEKNMECISGCALVREDAGWVERGNAGLSGLPESSIDTDDHG
jgi:hypothetical protein